MSAATQCEIHVLRRCVKVVTLLCFFFFSSRRRHTRSLCDWSSDVCSSDLMRGGYGGERPTLGDHALGATHRMLVELGWPEVPIDGALGREARGLQRGGPFAFGGAGGMRGHAFGSDRRGQARERRPCSCASTAASTAMFTISLTSEPRCSTCTGCAIPTRMGPIASAPPTRLSSL